MIHPGASPEIIARHQAWLEPALMDPASGLMIFAFHSTVIKTPRATILVDTCSGNDKERPHKLRYHRKNWPYLANLAAAGFVPEHIDYVLCTHLHADHVGWNTRLEPPRRVWEHGTPSDVFVFDDQTHIVRSSANSPQGLRALSGPSRARVFAWPMRCAIFNAGPPITTAASLPSVSWSCSPPKPAILGCSIPPIGSRHGWPERGRTNRSTSRKPIPRSRSVGRAATASRDRHSFTSIRTPAGSPPSSATREVIRKGKAGKPTEFGKIVKLQEAENQIVVAYEVYDRRPSNSDLLLAAIETHQATLGCTPHLVAADAGFYSAKNEAAAKAKGVKRVCIPNRSTKSPERKREQKKRWFRNGQKWRTGCEGHISVVKRRHGLHRSQYKGDAGIKRWVGLGVIADNLVNISRVMVKRPSR